MANETRLVRLKPYNPKAGCVLKSYSYRGIRFNVDRGWYRVSAKIAEELKSKRQQTNREHSPMAFDVCTEAEARALERAEKEAAERRRDTTSRIPLETARFDEDDPEVEDEDEDGGEANEAPATVAQAPTKSPRAAAKGKGRSKK